MEVGKVADVLVSVCVHPVLLTLVLIDQTSIKVREGKGGKVDGQDR